MPVVAMNDSLCLEDFQSRGRKPKSIPEGVFPSVQEWANMNYIEKSSTSVNLHIAARAGALWEIDLLQLAPCMTDLQADEFDDPTDGIPNLTSGINGLVNTWMKRCHGIPRHDRTHHTIIVRRVDSANGTIVRAFICKHVPYGTSPIVSNARSHRSFVS